MLCDKKTALCIVLVLCVCGFLVTYLRRVKETTIFVITPTFSRSTQQAELVRLCTVFTLAGNIQWIVVEDAMNNSKGLKEYLKNCGIPHTLLHAITPENIIKDRRHNVRGSAQRNAALTWLRQNYRPFQTNGIVYFGDDDNTYHPQIFKEMRTIKRGGTWPVGLIARSLWEGCITSLSDRRKIEGFWTNWRPTRRFPIDMAAFAVNLDIVLTHPDAYFDYETVGEQEGLILSKLGFTNAFDLEPKADGCSKLLVWHTQTIKPDTSVSPPNTIVNLL
nr:galactosylgalactosylxylosylprotein [Hymenolepis microstoma]